MSVAGASERGSCPCPFASSLSLRSPSLIRTSLCPAESARLLAQSPALCLSTGECHPGTRLQGGKGKACVCACVCVKRGVRGVWLPACSARHAPPAVCAPSQQAPLAYRPQNINLSSIPILSHLPTPELGCLQASRSPPPGRARQARLAVAHSRSQRSRSVQRRLETTLTQRVEASLPAKT